MYRKPTTVLSTEEVLNYPHMLFEKQLEMDSFGLT